MKSCSKCNVSLPKGVKRWKFQSAEVGGVPGKTGFLCSSCFHDVESVNRAKANSEHGESQTCSNCKAAFVKKTRSNNPNINNTGRLCSNCIHDVELGINSVESESINSNNAKGKADDESMTCCLNCKAVFVKNLKCPKRGYDRKSLRACHIPLEAFDGKEGFLCYKCIPVVQKDLQIKVRKSTKGMTRTPQSMKTRKRVVSVPLPLYYRETTSKYCSNLNSKKRAQGGFKKAAMDEIVSSHYRRVFLILIRRSEKARQAFYKVVIELITKEIKAYPKQGMLSKAPKFDYLKFIPWADIIEEASSPMPLLVHVLKAALPDPGKWERSTKRTLLGQKCLSRKQAKVILDRRLGFILSVIIFSKSNVISFIQGCISLQLRKNNCGANIMKCLNGMGVTKGLSGTVMMIKALKKQQQSAESPSNKTAHDDQGGSVGASCSRAVDLQSLSDVDDDIDMVEKLLQVTSMDF